MTCTPKSANCSRRTYSGTAGDRSHLSSGLNKKARATSRGSADDQSRKLLRTRPQGQVWEAVQDMFVTSRQRFVGLAYAILRNQEDAEDAVQNAMLSAYLHVRNFEGRSALSTWLTRIVLNAALMILRRRKHQWAAPLPESNSADGVSWPERLPDSKPDPETAYAEKETFKMLDALLGRMKPVHRQAFTLTHYHDMSSVAAAALLGVSTGTFKARLFRARKHLRNKVQRSLAAPLRRTTYSQFSLATSTFRRFRQGPRTSRPWMSRSHDRADGTTRNQNYRMAHSDRDRAGGSQRGSCHSRRTPSDFLCGLPVYGNDRRSPGKS